MSDLTADQRVWLISLGAPGSVFTMIFSSTNIFCQVRTTTNTSTTHLTSALKLGLNKDKSLLTLFNSEMSMLPGANFKLPPPRTDKVALDGIIVLSHF